MISRFDWMIKNDSATGVRLGTITMDVAIKYEAYITYLDFMEELNGLPQYKRRAKAITLTAKKFNTHYSTIWRYLSFFDYVSPTSEEITMYKNQTRWSLLSTCKQEVTMLK